MALCVAVNSNDTLQATTISPADCTSYVLVDANEYQLMLQTVDITPLSIAESFGWGFATYISFWWFGFVIKNAKMVIKKI